MPVLRDFKVEQVFDNSERSVVYNGQNRQVVETYSKVVILSPRRSGRFLIPGATATVDGKKLRSDDVRVSVQRTGLASAGSTGGYEDVDMESPSELQPGENVEEEVRKNFFLRAEANKTSCFVGEPLMVVYKSYSRLNTNAQVVKRPSLNGFSVVEMVDAYDNKQEIEVLHGTPFYVNIIRKVQLIPLQEGTFQLDPAEVEGVVHFNKREAASMGWTVLDYPVNVTSPPVNITVKPLPAAGQPDHYSGAVGKFSIAVQTPGASIRQGDLVKIQLVISGTGNLNLLTAPVVVWPKGVDTADPAVKENVNKYVYPLSGSKSFEYSFAAPDTGNCIIPAISLTYFDPSENTYKTASTDPVTLHILPGVTKAELEERNASLTKNNQTGVPLYLYFFGGIVLIIISIISYQSWQLKKGKKVEIADKAKDPIIPVQVKKQVDPDELLAGAREALQQADKAAFYSTIQQVLWKEVIEKCGTASSSMGKHQLAGILTQKGMPAEAVDNLKTILQDCELALYTPGLQADDMKRVFYQTRTSLQELQALS